MSAASICLISTVPQITTTISHHGKVYPASVVGKVRNLKTKLHKIDVDIACIDVSQLGGCGVTAHWSTMRIDVFEP